MSKKIHTILSSDKDKFDKEVNFFLDCGFERAEHEIIKNEDGYIFSQVVVIDTKKYDIDFYDNEKIKFTCPIGEDGELNGLWTQWYANGKKELEGSYKDGEKNGKWTGWYDSGKKREEGTYMDGKLDGLLMDWSENGDKWREKTYKDGELIDEKWF